MKRYSCFWIAALLLATSCVDHRYDYMVDDSAYFAKSDLQEETLSVMNAQDYVYEVWIHKSGYWQEKFAARLELDYNYLVQYNSTNGTDFEMLDEKYYTFERDFVIEEGENEACIPLTIKTEQILTDMDYGTYYIPLSVNSLTPGKEVYLEKSHFILALTLQQPVLKIDGAGFEDTNGVYNGNVSVDANTYSGDTYELDITAMLDVQTTEDLEVVYQVGEVKGSERELDSQYYSFTNGASVIMTVGEQYAENYLSVNLKDMPDGKWVIPVEISTTNDKVQVAEDKSLVKLTVIKGSIDEAIPCIGSYAQGSEIIVSSDLTLSDHVIANIGGRSMSYTVIDNAILEQPTWMNVSIQGSDVKLSINESNESTYKERLATITLVDESNLLEKVITVRQGMKGYGIILNKDLWSAELENDYGVKIGGTVPSLKGLYDNSWSTSTSNKLYVEFSKVDNQKGVTIIFDLGENPHQYTHLGLLPRIEWVAQSPKKVKIDHSTDKVTWTNGSEQTAFTEDELKNNGSWIKNDYECKTMKWFEISNTPITSRYVRISVIDSFWSSGSYISFDEFFISDKSSSNSD